MNAALRTDQSFLNQEQPYHHTGRSRLEVIGAGLVSQFRLDSLHLIYLGVFKRLILAWKKWNGPWKLRYNVIEDISPKLLTLKDSCPRDFNRPPRTLADLAFFKATEFRRILLYDGILIFRDSVAPEVYKHFLLLHCAIYILSSPSLVQMHCDYANKLLRTFISYSVDIYGPKFVVYNVHSLSHLASECEAHGKLDGFSAFLFENKLQSIKASLRSGYKPLKQAIFRDLEKGRINITLENGENVVVLSSIRKDYIINEVVDGTQFKKIHINDVIFQCNEKDSCFKTCNDTVAILDNILYKYKMKYFLLVFLFLRLWMHMNILYLLLILEFGKLPIGKKTDKFFLSLRLLVNAGLCLMLMLIYVYLSCILCLYSNSFLKVYCFFVSIIKNLKCNFSIIFLSDTLY